MAPQALRPEQAHLIWCNLNGRNRIAHFIDRAKESLFLQNERYQDEVIIERLARAAHRGVKIHVLACPRRPAEDRTGVGERET
jgi:cardiolipin synthase A/B